MDKGVIISLSAVCISFLGLVATMFFSSRKEQRASKQETENTAVARTKIESDIEKIKERTERIEKTVDRIDEQKGADHDKVVDHETRIKNLEKEVFKRSAQK